MKFCMNCGSKVETSVKFCPECGADLREADAHMKEVMAKCTEPADTSKIGKMGLVGNSMMGMNIGRSFTYSTHGTMFNSGITLKVMEIDGKFKALYRKTFVAEKDAKQFEVEDSFFDKITEIIDRYNGEAWDGFNGHADGVYDGDSFSFSYSDGKARRISASGYMAWPDGLRMAIGEIRFMFDEVYDRLWPDLDKILKKYIEIEVVGKYGLAATDVASGYPIKYPTPDGVLGFQTFMAYEGNDKANPGLRALVVLSKNEDGHTKIKLQYYGLERGEKPELLAEYLLRRDMLAGDRGKYCLFYFGTFDLIKIGFYTEEHFKSGARMTHYSFDVLDLKKSGLDALELVEADVERAVGQMTEADVDAFCKKANEGGMGFLETEWKNEWRRCGFISLRMIQPVFGYSWHDAQSEDCATEVLKM